MAEEQEERRISLEEMLARKTNNYFLCVNYDNEAFMNTGIQESSATPPFASTTTGPDGKKIPGKMGVKQDILTGMAFLGVRSGFFATANPYYYTDFIGKVVDALKTPGSAFIQVISSCQRGWRHPENKTAELHKLATDSGYWPLYSVRVKDGKPTYAFQRKPTFDEDKLMQFIKGQGKFAHIFKRPDVESITHFLVESVRQRFDNVMNLAKSFGATPLMESYKIDKRKLPNQEHVAPGHGLCAGCGEGEILTQLATGAQLVAGKNVVYCNATSCTEVSTSKDNFPSWKVPWVHMLYENVGTVADALSTGYRILKTKGLYDKPIPRVIALGGDGGLYDIGFQFLKAAIFRAGTWGVLNEDVKQDSGI
jgi:pyruvate/2-oxoacid:ferredoxin oxidoreductase beta subunit